MKKLFISAVLTALLGGALYYYYEMRKPQSVNPVFKDEVIGTWKIDSVAVGKKDSGVVFGLLVLALDSNYMSYTYTFEKDGAIQKKLGDSTIKEKLSYIVKDSTEFVFVEGDSTKETFSNKIVSFGKNNFTLMATDSTLLFFKRQ
jgi:hypothetical protein